MKKQKQAKIKNALLKKKKKKKKVSKRKFSFQNRKRLNCLLKNLPS